MNALSGKEIDHGKGSQLDSVAC